MKTPLVSLLLCLVPLLSPPPGHAQLVLNAGDSYVYQFDSLSYDYTFGISAPFESRMRGSILLNVKPDSHQSGDVFRLEMFETSLADTPICTSVSTFCDSPFAWGDQQGAIRLSMVSGSLTVNSLTFTTVTIAQGLPIHDDFLNVSQLSETVVVPEPGSIVTVGLAAFMSLLVAARRNRVGQAG